MTLPRTIFDVLVVFGGDGTEIIDGAVRRHMDFVAVAVVVCRNPGVAAKTCAIYNGSRFAASVDFARIYVVIEIAW